MQPLGDGVFHFLDTLLDPFRECIASAYAEGVEIDGFSKIPAVYREEIDKFKACLHLMEIKNELWFRVTEPGQLDSILRDNSGFPKVEFLKISLEKEDGDELPTGEALADALLALTSARNPVLACGSLIVEVTGVSKPAPAVRPILDVRFSL